jgi:DNA-binding transcriptional LysR family regulator
VDLRWLEIFCHVYQERSFSGAARRVGLSQPTVSDHVRSLEGELGVKLLDRSANRVRPTTAGKLLYDYGERILALKEEADRKMRHFLEKLEGELTLAASTIPGEYLLPEFIADFHRCYPGAQIVLRISDSLSAVEGVLAGRMELGFVGARQPSDELAFQPFAEDTLILVGPAENSARLPARLRLDQLKEVPLVIREPGSGTQQALERRLAEHGAGIEHFRVVLQTGSTAGLKQAVRIGLGYGFLSDRAVRDEIRSGLLSSFEVEEFRGFRRELYAVHHVKRPRSPLADAFLAHVSKR